MISRRGEGVSNGIGEWLIEFISNTAPWKIFNFFKRGHVVEYQPVSMNFKPEAHCPWDRETSHSIEIEWVSRFAPVQI
jgi:hypothetical protein